MCTNVVTISFCDVLEGSAFVCLRIALQLATENQIIRNFQFGAKKHGQNTAG
jgi:hypothetical protein